MYNPHVFLCLIISFHICLSIENSNASLQITLLIEKLIGFMQC